jgi:hypothetical protein
MAELKNIKTTIRRIAESLSDISLPSYFVVVVIRPLQSLLGSGGAGQKQKDQDDPGDMIWFCFLSHWPLRRTFK